jgi:hypothetical protein
MSKFVWNEEIECGLALTRFLPADFVVWVGLSCMSMSFNRQHFSRVPDYQRMLKGKKHKKNGRAAEADGQRSYPAAVFRPICGIISS